MLLSSYGFLLLTSLSFLSWLMFTILRDLWHPVKYTLSPTVLLVVFALVRLMFSLVVSCAELIFLASLLLPGVTLSLNWSEILPIFKRFHFLPHGFWYHQSIPTLPSLHPDSVDWVVWCSDGGQGSVPGSLLYCLPAALLVCTGTIWNSFGSYLED